jgi:hypothetical protein
MNGKMRGGGEAALPRRILHSSARPDPGSTPDDFKSAQPTSVPKQHPGLRLHHPATAACRDFSPLIMTHG